jgi:hypothetical protein
MGKLSRNITYSDVLATFALALSFLIPSITAFFGGERMQFIILFIGCLLLVIATFLLILVATKKTPDDIPTIKKSVEHATEIWGLWWNGGQQYKMLKNPEYTSKYKKILLLDFNNKDIFSKIMITSVGTKNQLREQAIAIKQIKRFTKSAIGSGVEVRWYSKMQVYSFTLYEPEDIRAYVVKSDLQQEPNRKHRKLSWFRIYEEKEKQAFDRLKIEFQQAWDSSRVPREEEYK